MDDLAKDIFEIIDSVMPYKDGTLFRWNVNNEYTSIGAELFDKVTIYIRKNYEEKK